MTDIPLLMSALSDPTRLAAVQIMWDGKEHCVCELMRLLGATQSRMSRHMSVLKSAGLVVDRRDAQWVRYRKNLELDPRAAQIVEAVVSAMKDRKKKAA